MNVPFFGVQREYEAHSDDFVRIFHKAMASGKSLQGGEIPELENTLVQITGRKQAIAVNSCSDALYFALIACGVKPGDEVLVTDFSFIASASCILRAQAKPVFVDIGPDHNMDFRDARRRISSKTKALVLVHLYGRMIAPSQAESFCKETGLKLIEDSAQAIGAVRDGRAAGSLGDASCISFDPTKPISSPGSGGCVLTNDPDMASRIRRLRYHGKNETKAEFIELGFNSQMPTLAAGIINWKLGKLSEWSEKRQQMAAQYQKGLDGLPVRLPPEEKELSAHIFHKFVIEVDDRDRLQSALKAAGVETLVHYAQPLHRQPLFSSFGFKDQDFPSATNASKTLLSLPIHPFLTNDEIRHVVNTVKTHYN